MNLLTQVQYPDVKLNHCTTSVERKDNRVYREKKEEDVGKEELKEEEAALFPIQYPEVKLTHRTTSVERKDNRVYREKKEEDVGEEKLKEEEAALFPYVVALLSFIFR